MTNQQHNTQTIQLSIEQWTQTTNTLSELSSKVNDIHTRLFGNGQPGELDKHEARIRELESSANHWRGIVAAVVALVGLFGGTEILHICGKI